MTEKRASDGRRALRSGIGRKVAHQIHAETKTVTDRAIARTIATDLLTLSDWLILEARRLHRVSRQA